jgi:hypothetical protein
MMETLLDHIVPELLRVSRVQKLLATLREVAFDSEQVAFAKVEQSVTSQEGRWDDDYLDQMIMQASESLVRQRLDSLVQDHVSEKRTLVSLTRSAVDRFVRLGSIKRVRELNKVHVRVKKSNLLTRIASVMFLMLVVDSCHVLYTCHLRVGRNWSWSVFCFRTTRTLVILANL